MHLRPQLSSIRSRFGYPYHQWMTQEFDETGWNLVKKSDSKKRAHDVTLLIEGPDGRFALMSKHTYPPSIFRSPSRGVNPGEDLLTGALREAKEETGLNVSLKRFLLHITLDISHEGEIITWDSYIFHATTSDTLLNPTDLKEVRETLWATREQLDAMAKKLKDTGNGGLVYRGNLTSSCLWALDNEMKVKLAEPKDLPGIEKSLQANKLELPKGGRSNWWIAEVNGRTASMVAITSHPDCVELMGLIVEPLFRGRGLGHGVVEYACDQWNDPERRAKLASGVPPNGALWLITPIPGYFIPVNFNVADKDQLPDTLRRKLTGPQAKLEVMRQQH